MAEKWPLFNLRRAYKQIHGARRLLCGRVVHPTAAGSLASGITFGDQGLRRWGNPLALSQAAPGEQHLPITGERPEATTA